MARIRGFGDAAQAPIEFTSEMKGMVQLHEEAVLTSMAKGKMMAAMEHDNQMKHAIQKCAKDQEMALKKQEETLELEMKGMVQLHEEAVLTAATSSLTSSGIVWTDNDTNERCFVCMIWFIIVVIIGIIDTATSTATTVNVTTATAATTTTTSTPFAIAILISICTTSCKQRLILTLIINITN